MNSEKWKIGNYKIIYEFSFTKKLQFNKKRFRHLVIVRLLDLIMNSFMCKQTQRKILIKDEKKENIAICAYFCI